MKRGIRTNLPHELRARAEALLQRLPFDFDGLTAEQAEQLAHEPQVHQIELEMPHEELRLIQEELDAERERYVDLYDCAPHGMGGEAAITALLAIDPAVVAVISSDFVNDPGVIEFAHHGFAGALRKPYAIEELKTRTRPGDAGSCAGAAESW